MEQRNPQDHPAKGWYALPLVVGAAVGYGIAGVIGALVGAFVVDAFRGLRGSHRLVTELEMIVAEAQRHWASWRQQPLDSTQNGQASHPNPKS